MDNIKTYDALSAYTEDIPNFKYPHVSYIKGDNEVKYNNDPGDFYNIWGTSTGSTSPSIVINENDVVTTKIGDYFVTNWTGGTVTSLSFSVGAKTVTKTIGKLGINTSGITNWSKKFAQFHVLQKINFDGVDTSSAVNMSQMFKDSYNISELNLSGFDTSNVTDMNSMFYSCSGLTSLDVSGFNTSACTSMANMFNNCNKLTSLDLSNFDTSNVTSMNGMFKNCNNLTSLDLSNFNVSGVTDMISMFQFSDGLTTLTINTWDMAGVTDGSTIGMFTNCNRLTDIYMNNTSQATLDRIKNVIIPGAAPKPKLHRDGVYWQYINGQWVSTPE